MSKNVEWKVTVAFALLCIVWGTTYLGIDIGIDYIHPFMLAALRHLIAGAIFLLICVIKKETFPTDRKTYFQLTKLGILLIVGGNALVCWAEQYINSGLAAIICAISPMFITLMSRFYFKNFKITMPIVVGLLMGFSGIVFIFYKGISLTFNQNTWLALLFLFIAICSWGIGSILIKKEPIALSTFMSIGLQMIIAGSINLIISLLLEDNSKIWQTDSRGIGALLYLVVFGSLIGYACYLYVLKYYPPARVSIHSYINTIIAVFVGWLLNNEPINVNIIIGTMIVIASVFIVNREYARLTKK
jgi:drug/metabolite transporter (DMT)-like permease